METSTILAEMDSFREDMKWFSDNLPALRSRYLNQYVLVKNQNVILSDKNYEQLLDNAVKKKIDVSISVIEKVTDADVLFLL